MRKIFFIAVFVLFFSGSVSAANVIGVSPGNVVFKDVLRGGYSERIVTISIDSDEPVDVELSPRGEIESWLEFPKNFTVRKGAPGRPIIAIKPPLDVPNGNYTGFLKVATDPLGKANEGRATSTVRAVVDLAIKVEITDQEVLSCRARAFNVFSAEKGDEVDFSVDILNQGNIRIKPKIVVEVWDQDQITIVKTEEFTPDEVLPTREDKIYFSLDTDDLDLDQYWVDVSVPDCFGSQTLTFDVLELSLLLL
jgi:hypothetical protein